MDLTQDVASQIAQLINEAPSKTLRGVQLGSMLRAKFPTFSPSSYKCRSLRQFIARYAPSVSESVHAGTDLSYSILDKPVSDIPSPDTPSPHSSFPMIEPDRLPIFSGGWRAFSNPGVSSTVAVNRATGGFRVIGKGLDLEDPWVEVPKPTAEVHREIAREFVVSLSEPTQTNLEALLHDPKWYVRFYGVASKNGLGQQWNAFRRNKLITKFHESLKLIGVSVPGRGTRKQETPVYNTPLYVAAIDRHTGSDESDFRSLVLRIVSELPIAELRLLKLPVGVVFDAFRK